MVQVAGRKGDRFIFITLKVFFWPIAAADERQLRDQLRLGPVGLWFRPVPSAMVELTGHTTKVIAEGKSLSEDRSER